MKKFITIKNDIEDKFVEKKSTFITYLIRITEEEQARDFIQQMKKKYYDAAHVCSAYVIGDNDEITRANDDGEPSGTAGTPMLDVLVKNNIKNVCAIVVRYFGGIKLGTGGLVRAYSGGVINALKKSTLVERKDALEISLDIAYTLNGKIEYEIGKTNFIVNNIEYSDKITYNLSVMVEDEDNFINWITEITSNNFTITSTKFKQLEFDIKE